MRPIYCCRPLLLAGLVLGTCSAVAADEPDLSRGIPSSCVRLVISNGAFQLQLHRQQTREVEFTDQGGGEGRFLADTSGGLAVRYQWSDADGKVFLLWVNECLEIAYRSAFDSGASFALLQDRHGGVRLMLDPIPGDAGSQVVESPSVWHLLLSEPVLAQTVVIPVLKHLRPDWNLDEHLRQIESRLFTDAFRPSTVESAEIERAVRQLGSGDFRQRQAANHLLRSHGVAIRPVLERLDPAGLDSEQRRRIRLLLDDLSHEGEDTVARVVSQLRDDVEIWSQFLEHSDSGKRLFAQRRLETILDRPLEFNPEGQREDRRRQIARLRGDLDLR